MKVLAIETSCDETAVSILEADGPLKQPNLKVLGNSLLSQIHIHEEYGGVVPNLAKREHEKNLPVLLERTLKEAGENHEKPNIDVIAVTAGPGLEPALWTGITFAEELGKRWNKPVIPVDHMEGHIYSVLYGRNEPIEFPALSLLVSGGHTEIVLIKDFGKYEILGKTRDDAVGEAFDKVARMLGLPYPGGPRISQLAEQHRGKGEVPTIEFPRPMISAQNFDFSFSGLKTAVLYKLKSLPVITDEIREEISRAFEDAAVETLVEKTRRALVETGAKTLVVGGGVAANKYLRNELTKLTNAVSDLVVAFPEKSLATDNAVMIGIAAYIRITTNPSITSTPHQIRAQGNLSLGA